MKAPPTRPLLFVLSATLFLLLSGLTAPAAHAADTFPIGICQSTAQGAAKFATALWKGAEIAIEAANAEGGVDGHKIEVVPVNIGNNDPSQARLSFSKVFEVNHIQSLLCWGTNVMVQNGPLIDEAGVASFTMSQGINVTKASKHTQQLEALTTLQCRVAAKELQANYPQVKTFAVLYVNYEYGIEVRDQCEIEFGKVGIKLVASEAHPNAPPDLRAQTTKLLQAKPDAIYLAAIGGGTIPLGIRAGRELGFKGLYVTSGSGDTPDVYNLKLAEENFFFVSHAVPETAPQAVQAATGQYGGYAGAGFDYAWLVIEQARSLAREGKPATGLAILERLRSVKRFQTPVNDYVFLENGHTVRPLAIFGVANGARKLERVLSTKDLE